MSGFADLLKLIAVRGETLATAESLTGGLLGATITVVPGASAVYRGGVVAYATDLKVSVLGVARATVAEHGVVSSECAAEMAEGALRVTGATWALATTGVAGPDEQEGKPVGTVFVAVAGPVSEVRELRLAGDREAIRDETVRQAALLLAELLSES